MELSATTSGVNFIGCKRVFPIKHKTDGSLDLYKADVNQ